MLFFNAGATDDRLREEDCRANVIHVAPTRSMLADGLAQYLVWKSWRKWFFVVGSHAKDKLWADALKRSATRFGAKIVEERTSPIRAARGRRTAASRKSSARFRPDARRAGIRRARNGRRKRGLCGLLSLPHVCASTRGRVCWSRSDELGPIDGAMGRDPVAEPLHQEVLAAHDGARHAGLVRRADDRRGGDAHEVGRRAGLRTYLLSPDFALAAFKGQKLTLRPWNLQLRQPILLSDGRNITSISPQEGFLHQVSELDTLGYDRPETKCALKCRRGRGKADKAHGSGMVLAMALVGAPGSSCFRR